MLIVHVLKGLQRIINMRRYNGRITFVPAPGSEDFGEPASYSNHDECSPSQEEPVKFGRRYQGPDVNLENMEWRTIEGPFVSVWLHNVPWGSEDAMAAPQAKVGVSDDEIWSVCCFLPFLFSLWHKLQELIVTI